MALDLPGKMKEGSDRISYIHERRLTKKIPLYQ